MKVKKHVYAYYCSEYEIPFFDVDSMNIMWHGHYIKYLELARCSFLEELGYTYDVMREKGYIWPIVQLNLKYVKPAFFRQKIRIDLAIIEYESCLRINYTIVDIASQKKLTVASTTQMAVEICSGETQFETPKSWQDALINYSGFIPQY